MAYEETSTRGLYERPLGPMENVMSMGIAAERPFTREPIRIHAFAEFTAPYPATDVVEAFKEAWIALRLLKSPDIATTFGDGHKRYQVPASDGELNAWVKRTLLVAQTPSSVADAVREMQSRVELLPVCYLVPQSAANGTFKATAILFISHWRTEAGGALKILDDVFAYASDILQGGSATRTALANHTQGSEVALLTPSFEDVFMLDADTSIEATTRVEMHFEDYYAALPSVDYPTTGDASAPFSSVNINQRTYTSAATSSLLRACRAHSISLTAAVHSAYLAAVWQLADPSQRSRSYASLMPAQLRKRLPESASLRQQGCWSASQMLMLTVPSGQSFMERAKSLKAQYMRADSPSWAYEDARETTARTIALSSGMPHDVLDAGAAPWFTSVGLLDGEILQPQHGELTIERVSVWADPIAPGIVLGLFTFRSSLSIQIHWNAAYHGGELIQKTLDIIDATLAQEMGVDMGVKEVRELAC